SMHYTLSLHDALPIYGLYYNQERTMYGFDNDGDEKINVLYIEEDTSTSLYGVHIGDTIEQASDMLSDFCWVSYESYEEVDFQGRSEEHTSELQSRFDL